MRFLHFFLDPLAVKELSGTSRRWQSFATRVLYVALIGFIVWEFTRIWEQQVRWFSVSDYARLGRQFFQAFFGLQMVVVTFSAVSAASDMVTKEARAGTLGAVTHAGDVFRSDVDAGPFLVFRVLYGGLLAILVGYRHASFNRITGRVAP